MDKTRSRKLFRKARQGTSDFSLLSESGDRKNQTTPKPHPKTSHPEAATPQFDSISGADDLYSSDYSDSHIFTESDSSDSDCDKTDTSSCTSDLRTWAVKHNITFSALSDLLDILKRRPGFDLPSDPRTLLRTPRTCAIEKVEPGESDEKVIVFMVERKKVYRALATSLLCSVDPTNRRIRNTYEYACRSGY
ncbi:hypothetical protein Fcan01_10662 [Folsomia candida]|uniref:Uncharacterized protein n=1 Tax=Folsomia candida TaxID=158441 RepID=A0A226EB12_FOLCA|nr:hypothetical protein Fcan01_10662 [Folsomia candida]